MIERPRLGQVLCNDRKLPAERTLKKKIGGNAVVLQEFKVLAAPV